MIFTFEVKVTSVSRTMASLERISKVTVEIQYISEDAVYSSGSVRVKGNETFRGNGYPCRRDNSVRNVLASLVRKGLL